MVGKDVSVAPPCAAAASTNGRSLSDFVMPKTTRASIIQLEMPSTRQRESAGCRRASPPRGSPAGSRAGKLRVGDAHHHRLQCAAAIAGGMPNSVPTNARKATSQSPMTIEMRAPKISRDNRSRPYASVPSRWATLPPACHTGGSGRSSRSCASRSAGASNGASSATRMAPATMMRRAVSFVPEPNSGARRSIQPDAWVGKGEHDINGQVSQYHDDADRRENTPAIATGTSR